MLDKNFKDIISNIKEEIINTQIKTMQEVNSNLIMLYFKLGKIVSENKQYGNNFTKQVSIELKLTFPNMKGFSERNIRSMRLFYEEYADDEKTGSCADTGTGARTVQGRVVAHGN